MNTQQMNAHLLKESNAEADYNRNRKRMLKAKDQLGFSRLFCVFGNFLLMLVCIARSIYWSGNIAFSARVISQVGEASSIGDAPFPLAILLCIYMPAMGVLAIIADTYERPLFLRICAYVSMGSLVIVLLNTLAQLTPTTDNIPTLLYLAAETAFAYIGLAAFNEIASLKDCEGYPDFDYAVQRNVTTVQKEYMEKREEYVTRQNAGLRRNDPERASDDIVTVSGRADEMDGVSVDIDDQEKWFRTSQMETQLNNDEEEDADMDTASADPFLMPHDEYYRRSYKDDIRHRPL
ncbi:MAG: hypothetical protein IJ080_04775 [Oscillospiraceae bacterium]|nr:hypothetical protein [Oscillospiraceae bacterium]